MSFSRVILAVALCVGLAGCRSATSAIDAVDVVAAVDRTDIEPELPATITITITNHGSEAVQVTDHWCAPAYAIRDLMMNDVPLPGRVCLAIAYPPRDLAPGETMTMMDRWAGETVDDGRVAGASPGRYEIRGRAMIDGQERRSAPVVVRVH